MARRPINQIIHKIKKAWQAKRKVAILNKWRQSSSLLLALDLLEESRLYSIKKMLTTLDKLKDRPSKEARTQQQLPIQLTATTTSCKSNCNSNLRATRLLLPPYHSQCQEKRWLPRFMSKKCNNSSRTCMLSH